MRLTRRLRFAARRHSTNRTSCIDNAMTVLLVRATASPRILSDHWNTLPELARLARKDSQFRAFVIGHVDATLTMDDVRKIRKNAPTQCPMGLRTVCHDLAKQADAALKEDASTS
jgi:hypothetical protein